MKDGAAGPVIPTPTTVDAEAEGAYAGGLFAELAWRGRNYTFVC